MATQFEKMTKWENSEQICGCWHKSETCGKSWKRRDKIGRWGKSLKMVTKSENGDKI